MLNGVSPSQKASTKATGTKVVPSLIIFTHDTTVEAALAAVKDIAAAAGELITSVRMVGKGTQGERCIFYTKEGNNVAVQSAVPILRAQGLSAKVYEDRGRGPASGLAAAAANGLHGSIIKTGVCQYFASQTHCRFGAHCRFECYKDH